MRTFVLRARRGSTQWERLRSQIGANEHFEIVLHALMNAFFVSNGFREDVEMYIVLESTPDFPRTIHLVGNQGLSLPGFHEEALLGFLEQILKESVQLKKDETKILGPGCSVIGFGFEKLLSQLLATRCVYLLDRKGEGIGKIKCYQDPVFILSDHLAMPKKSIHAFKRRGLLSLSLGKRMLFASQCITLLHYEMDNRL